MHEEDEAATIERISHLRQAVQELRAELHRERLSIQQQQQRQQQRGYAYCRGGDPSSVTSDIQPPAAPSTEQSSQHRRRRRRDEEEEDDDDDEVELEAAELASFYKRKISEIEAECCAGLARIRDNFNESATRLYDEVINDEDMMTKSETASDEHLVRSEAYEELPSDTHLAF